MTLPPHLRALISLRKARVEFLIIGAAAIDLFMPETGTVYMTADCDILARPVLSNLRRALKTLRSAGYAFSLNGEPLLVDALVLRRLLENRSAVRAHRPDAVPIDILLEARGFTFAQWWARRTLFKAGHASLPCASLQHVLESKRLTGRKKDRALLKLVAAAHGGSPKPRRRR